MSVTGIIATGRVQKAIVVKSNAIVMVYNAILILQSLLQV